MPKTPPLIIPNNIPNDWMSRSKINKSNNKVKNIFAAQNKKQLRFDESEELQFGDSFDPSSEIGLGDFHPQHNEQQIASSPPAASEVFYFTPLNQQNNPSQTSFKHSQHSQDQSKSVSQQQQKQQLYMQTDTPEQEKQHSMDIDQPKESQEQIVTQNNENFNTTLVGEYITNQIQCTLLNELFPRYVFRVSTVLGRT